MGADEVVDYTTQDQVAMFKDRPFDGVVDLVGGRCSLLHVHMRYAQVYNEWC